MWHVLCLYYGLTWHSCGASKETAAETASRAVCFRLSGPAIYADRLFTQLIAEASDDYASLLVEFPLVATSLMNYY